MKKAISIVISIFFMVGIFGGCIKKTSTAKFQSAAVLTGVEDLGQQTEAIVFKYDGPVEKKNLSTDTYEITYEKPTTDNTGKIIESKTVIAKVARIYTTDKIYGEEKDSGNYVVVSLEAFPYANNFKVTQKKDVNNSGKGSSEVKLTKADIKNVKTSIVDEFKRESYKDQSSGSIFNYRLFVPKTEKDKKYPLVLVLHGEGEVGNDNTKQLTSNKLGIVFASPENQEKNPSYVVAPQLPPALTIEADKGVLGWNDPNIKNYMLAAGNELIQRYSNIDRNRLYIVGMSMGAAGAFGILEDAPEIIAAAVPIAGMGDVSGVSNIKGVPIWAFHAENDPIVPVTGRNPKYSYNGYVKGTRDIVEALRAAGGNIKYTEYKANSPEIKSLPNAHFSWVPTLNNKEVIDWLYSQKK